MRRSPLRRGEPLRQGKPLDASGELKRTRGMTRAGRLRKALENDAMQGPAHDDWKRKVTRFPCALCKRPGAWPRDPHHVLPQRYIRRHVRSLRLPEQDAVDLLRVLLWDTRNGICLCRGCHADHEGAARRLPREMVPASAREFAAELGLEWVLDRLYPGEPPA